MNVIENLSSLKPEGLNLDGISNAIGNLKGLDISDLAKITKLINKKEEEVKEEKKVRVWVIVLAIIGILAVGAIIGYLIYRYFKPDYLEDFDDEFEDIDEFDDDDDFFVDEGDD